MKYNSITRPLRALRLAGLAGIVSLSTGCNALFFADYQRNYSDNYDNAIKAIRETDKTGNIQKRNELLEAFKKNYPNLYIQEIRPEDRAIADSIVESRVQEAGNQAESVKEKTASYFDMGILFKRLDDQAEERKIQELAEEGKSK